MKRLIVIVSLLLAVAFPALALAQPETPTPTPHSAALNLGEKEIYDALPNSRFDNLSASTLFSSVLSVLNILVAFLAVVGMIASGIMFITAGGDSDKASKARQNIIWIIVGVVLYSLILWVAPILRATVCTGLNLNGQIVDCR